MYTTPTEYLSPTSKRTLQSARYNLNIGTAAFYLGAGVDTQLVNDARKTGKKIPESPTWIKLLQELHPFPNATEEEMKDYARDWPTETASVARLRLGEDSFKNKISELTDFPFAPNLRAPFTKALCSLLLKANIIVTPNYTSHILRALKQLIKRHGLSQKKEVIVLTREDLATFQFPAPESNPSRIFLIYLHGRCVERSSLVLDAWGYNVAVNDDPYYHSFLYNLFSFRNIISIGTSWSDIPLRNQAALVFRTQGYQRPSHISFDYCSKKHFAKNIKAQSPKRKWSNAMHAAYGVRMLIVDEEKQQALLRELSPDKTNSTIKPNISDIEGIASYFDSCGDYESPIQQRWLLDVSMSRKPSATLQIRASVLKLYDDLISRLSNDPSTWKLMARLERHLRHYHYLYVAPSLPHDRRRERLWNDLAHTLTKSVWKNVEPRLRFDFLIGQHELKQRLPEKVKLFKLEDSLYDKRLAIGKDAWRVNLLATPDQLGLRLIDVGWEALASKVILDLATEKAKKAPKLYEPEISKNIVELTLRGGSIASSVGCFRREVKAETLAAMWLPDPQESRIRILSKIRAAEFQQSAKGKTTQKKISVIEPGLIAALTAGLLASHIRNVDHHSVSESDLDTRLKTSVGPLLEEAGLNWHEVPHALLPYWSNLIERRLQNCFGKAISGKYIK